MKTWDYGHYQIILLETNICKCLHIIDNQNKELCGWLDFDGFYLGVNSKVIVSGIYILEPYKNKGLLQILTGVLEVIYLENYNCYSIEVDVMNPKIKSYIRRLMRTSRFNNAEWVLDESKSLTHNAVLGALIVFNILTKKKKQLLIDVGVI
ncbi:hypothetical protein [Peribacillus loiseleuriae]|uniref:hypothetical protein n=1 Tax=Peribacillus loiseleuriae TaxID=1679170 RepID=UPI003CFEA6AE